MVAARGAHGRVAPRQIFRALSSQQLQWSVQHTPLHGLSRCTPALEPRPHVSSPSCDLLANFVDPVNSPATSPCAGPAALHVLLGRRSGLASCTGWRVGETKLRTSGLSRDRSTRARKDGDEAVQSALRPVVRTASTPCCLLAWRRWLADAVDSTSLPSTLPCSTSTRNLHAALPALRAYTAC